MNLTENRRAIFLDEMGVGVQWRRRSAENVAAGPVGLLSMVTPASETEFSQIREMDWDQLNTEIAACTACGLCLGRTKAVPGAGDRNAKWLFVGEGPGQNEDMLSEPFLGRSGELFDNMLLAMGLKRNENVFITNVVKCRPTDIEGADRSPTILEAGACRPYLDRQIALLKPVIIVALGKTAALSLLTVDEHKQISALRGIVHRFVDSDGNIVPLIVTYHPAYLLRRVAEKGKSWSDLCLAMQTYSDETSRSR